MSMDSIKSQTGQAPLPSSPMSPEVPLEPMNVPVVPMALLPPAMSDMPLSHMATVSQPVRLRALQEALNSAKRLLAGQRKMRILVLSSDTGGGHRASAQALRCALEKLHPGHVDINIVDFWVDLAEGPFSNFPKQYTFLAKHPWMWKLTYEITRFPLGRAATESFFSVFGHKNIRKAFLRYQPDLILSVHPLVNTLSQGVLRDMERQTEIPSPPYVTVVTDLGGAHPTWFHRRTDMIYIPSDGVRTTASRVGISSDRLRMLGLPVRPDFWDAPPPKRELRQRLGMRVDGPAVLAVGGGDGVGGLRAIVTALATDLPARLGDTPTQLVVICGKNERLRSWLADRQWRIPLIALGYVSNMSDWMAACDILCTKAGPGTISEGLIRGLPIVITGFLPGQEEANVKYVVDNGVGAFAKKPARIVNIVAEWMADLDALSEMSVHAQQLGRPQASLDIATDIVRVAKDRIAEKVATLERSTFVAARRAQTTVQPGALAPFIPYRQLMSDSSSESHVVVRVKLLMRMFIGSFLARDALRGRRSQTPPSSPLEPITDGKSPEEIESNH